MAHLYQPPDKKPPAWRNSPAKAALKEGILSGEYPESMAVEFVYGNNPLFRQYRWENFKTNYLYKNLRDALNQEIDRAIEDEGNLAKDKPHHVVVNSSCVAGVAKMFTMDLMKVALKQAFWFGGLDQGVSQAPATTDNLLDKNI